jgi:hypothetical protein
MATRIPSPLDPTGGLAVTFDQFLDYVRSVDRNPILNHEIYGVLMVQWFNEGGKSVIALVTSDGRARIVMVDGQFHPDEDLDGDGVSTGEFDHVLELFQQEYDRIEEYEAGLEVVREYVLARTDDQLMQLKAEWMHEAREAAKAAT